jgi:hypothetical protein
MTYRQPKPLHDKLIIVSLWSHSLT